METTTEAPPGAADHAEIERVLALPLDLQTEPADPDLSHGIGATLRAMRRAREMTQAEVATIAGVSASTVSEIESGNQNLSIDMLWRLCQALRVRPHITLRGTDSPRPLLQIELDAVGEVAVDSEGGQPD